MGTGGLAEKRRDIEARRARAAGRSPGPAPAVWWMTSTWSWDGSNRTSAVHRWVSSWGLPCPMLELVRSRTVSRAVVSFTCQRYAIGGRSRCGPPRPRWRAGGAPPAGLRRREGTCATTRTRSGVGPRGRSPPATAAVPVAARALGLTPRGRKPGRASPPSHGPAPRASPRPRPFPGTWAFGLRSRSLSHPWRPGLGETVQLDRALRRRVSGGQGAPLGSAARLARRAPDRARACFRRGRPKVPDLDAQPLATRPRFLSEVQRSDAPCFLAARRRVASRPPIPSAARFRRSCTAPWTSSGASASTRPGRARNAWSTGPASARHRRTT